LLFTFRLSISNPFRVASQTKHNSCFLLQTIFSLSCPYTLLGLGLHFRSGCLFTLKH
jgi:hypothetical protein